MRLARLVGDTKVEQGLVTSSFGDEIQGIKVTIGKIMADHEMHELIMKFRQEFEVGGMVVKRVSGTELHGYALITDSI